MAMYDGPDPMEKPYKRKRRLSEDNDGGSPPFGPPNMEVDPMQKPQRFRRPAPPPGMNEGQPGRPPKFNVDEEETLAKRKKGDATDGFSQRGDAMGLNRPDVSSSAGGDTGGVKPPKPLRQNTDPMEGERLRQMQATIRSRGPAIEDLVRRRQAQRQERSRRFGNTPTGGDPMAPKPILRARRRAFNPYGGNYS